MRPLTFGMVTEGPVDVEVLSHIILKVLPGKHRFLPIQPDLSETEGLGVKKHSNGWKGVLTWCEASAEGDGILSYMDQTNVDVLIIQVDADIARDAEINCARPCPMAEDTVIEIEKLIKEKLKRENFHDRIICCIPSDNTEAWALVAFDNDRQYHGEANKHVECVHDPDDILSKPPFRLIRRKDGKPKKNVSLYREQLIPTIVERWDYIREYCSQAEKLHQRLLQLSE
ncbi:hypothetical protein KP806_15625 [Paenibacillus sp. N4]|uniref:hypothetical protein n=1 Tax=Paenibacillus vietnamensis TaxID=2590547 RepID=UPI001CD15BB6|nr:hypothetical protein [Paenibacillus vietnamensis]MCA0756484.1 hypothetical protein [Paenibacillus vietnamensis]